MLQELEFSTSEDLVVQDILKTIGDHYEIKDIQNLNFSSMTTYEWVQILDYVIKVNGISFIVVPNSFSYHHSRPFITNKVKLSYQSLVDLNLFSQDQIQNIIYQNRTKKEIIYVSQGAWNVLLDFRVKKLASNYSFYHSNNPDPIYSREFQESKFEFFMTFITGFM